MLSSQPINTFDDFESYIKSFNYSMINKIPNDFYIFILENKNKINIKLLKNRFPTNYLINEIKIIKESRNGKQASYFSSIGNLECLKYVHKNGYGLDNETCNDAAENGHLECLKYAHKNGYDWDIWTCDFAAENGHLECLKYAHKNGCPWDEGTCNSAAENGHLECLKYAHKNGCPWENETCNIAARNGHLECLKYAHKNGCEWLV